MFGAVIEQPRDRRDGVGRAQASVSPKEVLDRLVRPTFQRVRRAGDDHTVFGEFQLGEEFVIADEIGEEFPCSAGSDVCVPPLLIRTHMSGPDR